MRRHLLVYTMILAVILIVGMLILFPPWYTIISGNGYPRIDFQWIGSPPLPIDKLDYHVDVERLVTRIAVVILSLAAAYGVIKILQLRRTPNVKVIPIEKCVIYPSCIWWSTMPRFF